MPNNKKNKSNRRRRQTGGGARVSPTTEELEREYQRIHVLAREGGGVKETRKIFEENSPMGVEFQIVKHKNLIKGKDKQIEACQKGLLLCMFAKIRFLDDPEELENFKKQDKLGNDKLNDLNNWKRHSELMVKLFNCFVKGSVMNDKIASNVEVGEEIIKNTLKEVKDNIHKVVEGVEVMVQYGSDFYTEGQYNDIAIMFKEEYEMWSNSFVGVVIS
tara:strand:- start:1226 stop:1876 length:651 start_codon:yes stop_codon:yes gene_type:complete